MSTCVNFIHQKDATDAMRVVDEFIKRTEGKGPIYTVDENLITTAPYAKMIPNIYIYVFMTMASPLRLKNELINDNLIKPVIPYYMDFSESPSNRNYVGYIGDWIITNPHPSFYHWVADPIPVDHLIYFIEYQRPPNFNLEECNKWYFKISEIGHCYKN